MNIAIDLPRVIEFLASTLVPVILYVVSQSAKRSAHERKFMMDLLREIQDNQQRHETRLTVLEERWYDLDDHPTPRRFPRK